MLDLALFLFFPFMMVLAGAQDLLTMKISNSISLILIAGFVVFAWLSGMDLETFGWHWAMFAIVLSIVFVLFGFGMFGGGDAKIIASASLWFGWENMHLYILSFAVCGGALALLIVIFRANMVPGGLLRYHWIRQLHSSKKGMPYGVALAIAALQIYPQTSWINLVVPAG